MVSCSKERMEDKIKTFSKFGDTGKGGITRLCFTEAELAARKELVQRCKALGMEVKTDDMANIYATLKGTEDLPAIVSGSHMDSVIQGGNYDGILGVLTPLEVAETLVKENIKLRHPFTVMAWTNEEGSRFRPAMMCSGVVLGKFDEATMLAVQDKEGVSFQEALEASGYKGDRSNRLNDKEYMAMLELHIEQGPVLEAEQKDIGVVEGVVGMVNYGFEIIGQADHAGTTPMKVRQDALYAAAQIIQELWNKLGKLDDQLVFTMGEFALWPNVHTVIPDKVVFCIDSRHKDPAVIEEVVKIIQGIPAEVAKCKVRTYERWARKTVHFNQEIVGYIQKGADEYGYPSKRMYAGAGHDAQYVADLIPTAMIFVPSVDGHSHCEIEHTPVDGCLKGANVLLQAVLEIDKK